MSKCASPWEMVFNIENFIGKIFNLCRTALPSSDMPEDQQ